MPAQAPPTKSQSPLADPALRRMIEDFVRRRVPAPDVDDVVQTVLVDALAAPARPANDEELRKWVLGIARHKVADHHRRAVREPATELPEIEAGPEPLEARSLARWAEEQAGGAGEGQKTLAWMAREGEGEKLESIAAEENVPAARVRQRVSRMRRWMKERWLAELAAVAVIAAVIVVAWKLLRRDDHELPEARPDKPEPVPSIAPEAPTPLERARQVRADALKKCEASAWKACLDGLDEAARVDPVGDTAPGVAEARERAKKALSDPTLNSTSKGPQEAPPILKPTPTSAPPSPPPSVTGTSAVPKAPPPSPSVTPTISKPKPESATPGSFGTTGGSFEKKAPSKPTGASKTGGGSMKGSSDFLGSEPK